VRKLAIMCHFRDPITGVVAQALWRPTALPLLFRAPFVVRLPDDVRRKRVQAAAAAPMKPLRPKASAAQITFSPSSIP